MSSIMVLSEAIQEDRADDFRKILESNILTPEQLDWMEYTLLLEACFYKRTQIVRFLLTRGCRIFYSTRSDTPLHLAVSAGDNLKIVNCLIARGASLSIDNEQGNTPLHVAFITGSSNDVVDLLLDWSYRTEEQNLVNNNGLSSLHIACTRPNLAVIQQFIRNSKSAECVNRQVCLNFSTGYSGYTPLHFAVKSGSLRAVVLLLLQSNIDLHKQDANLSTPIHLACEMRNSKMVKLLLNHDKQKKNSVNISGLSHFMAACMTGELELVNALLDSSKNPFNMVNGHVNRVLAFPFAGFTPLHFAAEHGHTEVVKRLLQVGAKINSDECSPIDLALKNNYLETACVFQDVSGRKRKRVS